jgi:Mn-dependent DtxR family transcriptional regulator
MPTLSAVEIPLEDPQKAYLKLINDFQRNHRMSPSYKELGDLMGRSKTSAKFAIARLARKGLLQKTRHGHRNLVITELGYVVLARPEAAPETEQVA